MIVFHVERVEMGIVETGTPTGYDASSGQELFVTKLRDGLKPIVCGASTARLDRLRENPSLHATREKKHPSAAEAGLILLPGWHD